MKNGHIEITRNYAIKSDGNRCISIYERRIIDPTKSPGWAKKVASNPELDGTPRETWTEIGSYHGKLETALQAIIDRTALVSEAETLAELVAELRAVKSDIMRAYEIRLTAAELATLRAE